MRAFQPLAFLSKRQNVCGRRKPTRRDRHVAAAIQPAGLRSEVEPLESRLLLTVTAPASAFVLQNSTLVFSPANNNSITVTGLLAFHNNRQVNPSLSLSVSHGTLTLGSLTGLIINAGSNGTASMTLTGTAKNINAALDGLTYTPTFGFSGDDSLVVSYHAAAVTAGTVSLYINSWTDSTAASLSSEQAATGGEGLGMTLLLPNGDLMVHGGAQVDSNGNTIDGGASANWFEITPDVAGNYADGTWTELAPMHAARLYFSSDVLPNGEVFVMGGEFASDGKITTSRSPVQ